MRIPLVLILSALGTLCSCESVTTSVGADFLRADVTGKVALAASSGGSALSARQIPLRDGFGVGGPKGALQLRGEAKSHGFRLRASGFRYESTGSSVLATPFGDLSAGTPVSSDLEFRNVKTMLTYDLLEFPLGKTGTLRIAPGVEGDYIGFDLDVTATSISAFESVDNDVIVPMPAILGEIDYGVVAAAVDFGGLAVGLGDASGDYWDLEGALEVRPIDQVELRGGYRWISAEAMGKADGRDFDSDIDVRGWFVGGSFVF